MKKEVWKSNAFVIVFTIAVFFLLIFGVFKLSGHAISDEDIEDGSFLDFIKGVFLKETPVVEDPKDTIKARATSGGIDSPGAVKAATTPTTGTSAQAGQGTVVGARSFCENPSIIVSNTGGVNGIPKIHGRYVVYSSPSGAINFYDLETEGSFEPFLPPPGSSDNDPKIYGSTVIFIRSFNNRPNQTNKDLMIYSLGPNGVLGGGDDIGPAVIVSGSITRHSIDEDLVWFIDYSDQYCNTDYPSGTCWNGGSQQIVPTVSASQYLLFDGAVGIGGIFANNFFFWKDVIVSRTGFRNFDMYYQDSLGSISGPLFTDPLVGEVLEDISWPIGVYVKVISSMYSFPIVSEANSSVHIFFIQTNPVMTFEVSPEVSGQYNRAVRMGHDFGSNGERQLVWIRHYTDAFRSNTWEREYIVSSFPSMKEVKIPNTLKNGWYHYNAEIPDIDGNTVVWNENGNLMMSKCYL